MSISEEISRAANVESGKIDINDSAVRDNINSLIDGITCHGFTTPYIALERASKVLASYHIYLPKYTFMEGDSGMATFPAHQFGEKVGMTNDGEVVTKATTPYTIYFEYQMNDYGTYDIFCSIVTEDELEDLMDAIGEELEEAVTLPETGPRHKPGASVDAEPSLHMTQNEIEDEYIPGEKYKTMIRAIVKRAMQPGIKFAGDETGPNGTPKSNMTEEAKKKVLVELSKFGAAYKAARASGQSKFKHNGKEYSSELDKSPVTLTPDTSSAQTAEPAKAAVAAPSSVSVPMPRPRPAQATPKVTAPSSVSVPMSRTKTDQTTQSKSSSPPSVSSSEYRNKMIAAGIATGMPEKHARQMASISALESGHGKSRMATQGNNPFGQTVKGHGQDQSKGDGALGYMIGADKQKHAKYEKPEDAVAHHMGKWGKHYGDDINATTANLVKAGYNTVNKDWSRTIASIHNKNDNTATAKSKSNDTQVSQASSPEKTKSPETAKVPAGYIAPGSDNPKPSADTDKYAGERQKNQDQEKAAQVASRTPENPLGTNTSGTNGSLPSGAQNATDKKIQTASLNESFAKITAATKERMDNTVNQLQKQSISGIKR